MDLRALRYFVAAVEEGSISGAATRCYIAQPSITLAISKLEDELGCRLLNRHRKGVALTAQGEKFYPSAKQLLEHAAALSQQFKPVDTHLTLNLYLDQSIRIAYVSRLVNLLEASPYRVQFKICFELAQADLIVTTRSSASNRHRFIPMGTEEYALLIPKQSPLAHQVKFELNDLDQTPFIERTRCENRPVFDYVLKQHDIEPVVVAEVDNEEWAISLVGSGIGLTIAPIARDFEDPRFAIRYLNDHFSFHSPTREIGVTLCAEPDTQTNQVFDYLLEHLITEGP